MKDATNSFSVKKHLLGTLFATLFAFAIALTGGVSFAHASVVTENTTQYLLVSQYVTGISYYGDTGDEDLDKYSSYEAGEQPDDDAPAILLGNVAYSFDGGESAAVVLAGDTPSVLATTTGVKYIDEGGAAQTRTDAVTIVEGSTSTVTWSSEVNDGWYYVDSDVEISGRITCDGDIHLILGDNATLTAKAGIAVNDGEGSLTIYAQSDDEEVGALVATATGSEYAAGIGGDNRCSNGAIVINGGNITAIGSDASWNNSVFSYYGGAGIGGGAYGDGKDIDINGGVVTATAGSQSQSAGIGGGYNGDGINIFITGGIVTAQGMAGIEVGAAAGIGGGNGGSGYYILISGGIVNATGAAAGTNAGAGIGGGYGSTCDGYNITIAGGVVNATAYAAAGIGGGSRGAGYNITIRGGFVTAQSQGDMAIGNGYYYTGDSGATDIAISYETGSYFWRSSESGYFTSSSDSILYIDSGSSYSYLQICPALDIQLFIYDDMTIYDGDSLELEGYLSSELDNYNISEYIWESSDTSYATVDDNGVVRSVMLGETTITLTVVTDEGVARDTIVVWVAAPPDFNVASVSLTGWSVGESPNTPVVTATYGAYEAIFTYSTSENGVYTSTVPTTAGTYYVKATIPETVSYYETEAIASFTISKGTPTVSVSNTSSLSKTYDGSAVSLDTSNVSVTGGTVGNVPITGEVSLVYYSKSGNDYTQLDSAPTDVGSYAVRAYVASDDNWKEAYSDYYDFTISKATPTASDFIITTPSDLVYSGSEKEVSVATAPGVSGMGTYTVEYSSDGGTWSTTAPTDTGTYQCRIVVGEGDNYTSATLTDDSWTFTIAQADSTISFKEGTATTKTYDGQLFEFTTSDVTTSGSSGRVIFTYYEKNGDEWAGLDGAPSDAGSYKVIATLEEDSNYKSATDELEFSITQATNEWTTDLSITGWTYGETANSPAAVAKFGEVTYTYSDSLDGEYTSTVPSTAGTWYVKATVAGTSNYTSLEDIKEFTIAKSTGTTISIDEEDIASNLSKTYDGDPVDTDDLDITVSGSTSTPEFKWEYWDGEKWVETNGAPTDAGSYRVTIVVPADDNYEEVTSNPIEFTISKASSSISFKETPSLDKVYDQESVSVIVSSDTITVTGSPGEVSIIYYQKNADGDYEAISGYPTDAGDYAVRAYVEGDNNYEEAYSDWVYFTIEEAKPSIYASLQLSDELSSDTNKLSVGDIVTLYLTVTNTGNTALEGVTYRVAGNGASRFGFSSASGSVNIDVGSSYEYTITTEVTQEDIDNGFIALTFMNVSATCVNTGVEINNADSSLLLVVNITQNSSISITKTSIQSGSITNAVAGETEITSSYTVTNTGNTTLSDVSLADELVSGSVTLYNSDGNAITSLAPGGVAYAEVTYTLTQSDIDAGSIAHQATVSATAPDKTLTDYTTSLTSIERNSSMTLDVTVDEDYVAAGYPGDEISYTYTVANTGNTTLSSIVINDSALGEITPEITTIAPGETTTVTVNYELTQYDFNMGIVEGTATAIATAPDKNISAEATKPEATLNQIEDVVFTKTTDTAIEGASAGDKIEYTFTVENTGNVSIGGLSVIDPLISGQGNGYTVELDNRVNIDSGGSTTGTAYYTLTQEDIDRGTLVNVATLIADTPVGATPSYETTSGVTVTIVQTPELTITKSTEATDLGEIYAGQEITYEVTVENTGNVTIDNINLTDDIGNASIGEYPESLAPGEDFTVEVTYVVTQEDIDNGSINNTTTVTGEDPKGNTITSSSNSITFEIDQKSSMGITQNIVGDTTLEDANVGDTIQIEVTIENTGNTTITNVNIENEIDGEVIDGETEVESLAPGEKITIVIEHELTQEDIDSGTIGNSSNVSGKSPDGSDITSGSSVLDTEVVIVANPDISLTKTANVDVVENAIAGTSTVTFMYTITNTGNTTLNDITLVDDYFGEIELETNSLASGASTVVTKVYTVTQDEIDYGSLTECVNAYVTAKDVNGSQVSANDYTSVEVEALSEIDLTKEVVGETTIENASAGDVIEFRIVAENTGHTTLYNVVIEDLLEGVEVKSGNPGSKYLVPGEYLELYVTYTLTQEDIDRGDTENIATVTSQNYKGTVVEDQDDAKVTTPSNPSISFSLTSNVDSIESALPSDEIYYTFTITNTGNTTIDDFSVSDELLGEVTSELDKTEIAPGESTVATLAYDIAQEDIDTGYVYDEANVEGTDPHDTVVVGSDETTVTLEQDSSLTVDKKVSSDIDTSELTVGDEVTYTITISNDGNTTITDITLIDELLGGEIDLSNATKGFDSTILGDTEEEGVTSRDYYDEYEVSEDDPITTLRPGEYITIEVTYTITQEDMDNGYIGNSAASATGEDPSGESVIAEGTVSEEEDEASLELTQHPDINVDVTTNISILEDAVVGDEIIFTITITNTGDTTVERITVEDTLGIFDLSELEDLQLAPGESFTLTGTYTVTQEDLDNGGVEYYICVTANGLGGEEVLAEYSGVAEVEAYVEDEVVDIFPKTGDSLGVVIPALAFIALVALGVVLFAFKRRDDIGA